MTIQALKEYTEEVFDLCKEQLPEEQVFSVLDGADIGKIVLEAAFDGCTPQEAVKKVAEQAGIRLDN